ncbi:MAG: electron transfer flavoprotein subunit beta/FixA family protein [Pseudomonadota bacterium]
MKILVSVKRVVDYNVRIQIKPDGSGVVSQGVKMSMNPFDEIAVEEAIRLKEAGKADEVVIVSIGPRASQEQVRSALAMGADRGLLVQTNAEEIQPLAAAKVLAAVVAMEKPGLVLMGKQAIDDDAGQTPQMLAALLDWPQATFASNIVIDERKANVTREIDAGLETLCVDLPAVISVDLRLNEPRYVKLPEIMKAKKKPFDVHTFEELGVAVAPMLNKLRTAPPAAREAGVKLKNVAELVSALKDRGVL